MVISLLFVHSVYIRHLLISEGEVEQIKVGPYVVRVFRSRDNDVTVLDMPSEDYLGVGFAVFFSQLRKERLLYERFVAVAEWIPCLYHYIVTLQELLQLLFLRVRMDLGLEDGRLYLTYIEDLLYLIFVEVG